jgi:DNA repair photolyase
LLRQSIVVDPWFLGRFGSNLYRGCSQGCVYCDGRAEKYFVHGTFDADIEVKRNAIALADVELNRRREPGILFLGGGVCDAYQLAEQTYRLARGILELCHERAIPVHVLTKSGLVERDLELLAAINRKSRAILSFSFSTTNDHERQVFEPGGASIAERFRLLRHAKDLGIATGIMAMPILPGISDSTFHVQALMEMAQQNGVDFVCHGALTLRPGRQKNEFLALLRRSYPELIPAYDRLYQANRASGSPDPRYMARLYACFREAHIHYRIPGRIPHRLFKGLLPLYTEVAVLLEHRGFFEGDIAGPQGPYARGCWGIGKWARTRLGKLRGKNAYRAVEAEFGMLIRSQLLSVIPELDPALYNDVADLYAAATAP